MIATLPPEILLNMIQYLSIPSFNNLSKACTLFQQLLGQDIFIEELLIGNYGTCAIYYLWEKHYILLERKPYFISRLLRRNIVIPRFLGQICHQQSLACNNSVSQLISQHASKMYQLQGDDVVRFEYLSNHLETSFDEIKVLFQEYHFIPSPKLTPSAPFRILKIALKEIHVLEHLIQKRAILIDDINDSLMLMLLSNFSMSPEYQVVFKRFIALGFFISPNVIMSQLRNPCSGELIETLLQIVPLHVLEESAYKVLYKMLGQDGQFDELIGTNLISTFELSDSCVRDLILHGYHETNKPRVPYQTRCFEQQQPIHIWNWIYKGYGAHHEFSAACFDDLLQWMTESSDYQLSYTKPDSCAALFFNMWNDNSSLLQPRHMEHIATLCDSVTWRPFVTNVISKLRYYIDTEFHDDLDYVWLWCVSLKQFSKGWCHLERHEIGRALVHEVNLCVHICLELVDQSNSQSLLPKTDFIKFSTIDNSEINYSNPIAVRKFKSVDSSHSMRSRRSQSWFRTQKNSQIRRYQTVDNLKSNSNRFTINSKRNSIESNESGHISTFKSRSFFELWKRPSQDEIATSEVAPKQLSRKSFMELLTRRFSQGQATLDSISTIPKLPKKKSIIFQLLNPFKSCMLK